MSANIENSNLPLKELLKTSGFYAEGEVADKTFKEATSGGGQTSNTLYAYTNRAYLLWLFTEKPTVGNNIGVYINDEQGVRYMVNVYSVDENAKTFQWGFDYGGQTYKVNDRFDSRREEEDIVINF